MNNIYISDEWVKKLDDWIKRYIALDKALKGLSDKKENEKEAENEDLQL